MKIRTGFVSNSSSSSFVCDFCGNDVSGWDASLSEAEMFQCINGHTICLNHLTEEEKESVNNPFKTKEEFIKAIMDSKDGQNSYWNEKADELLAEITDENWEDLINERYIGNFTDGPNYDAPASVCPLCTFKDISGDDIGNYLLKVLGQTKEQLLETVKTKFKSYKEFQTFIQG